MKISKQQSENSISFHKTTITTTVKELKRILGKPTCLASKTNGKVNYRWNCVNDNNKVCTIYDYAFYRRLGQEEMVEFHIGGENSIDTELAKAELLSQLTVDSSLNQVLVRNNDSEQWIKKILVEVYPEQKDYIYETEEVINGVTEYFGWSQMKEI